MSNHDNFNLSDRAHLEQMSTAELEELLRASVHPDSQMDESTILLILEVLEARDPAMQPQEVAAAWERFEREVIDASQTAQTYLILSGIMLKHWYVLSHLPVPKISSKYRWMVKVA